MSVGEFIFVKRANLPFELSIYRCPQISRCDADYVTTRVQRYLKFVTDYEYEYNTA